MWNFYQPIVRTITWADHRHRTAYIIINPETGENNLKIFLLQRVLTLIRESLPPIQNDHPPTWSVAPESILKLIVITTTLKFSWIKYLRGIYSRHHHRQHHPHHHHQALTSSFQMQFAPYFSTQKQCAAERTKRWEKKTKGENITSIAKLSRLNVRWADHVGMGMSGGQVK